MLAQVPVRQLSVFAKLPDTLRVPGTSLCGDYTVFGEPMDSFLEGPCFDAHGNLHLVDIANGRVLKIDAGGTWSMLAEYDGEPNGLKIDPGGKLWIADYKRGIVVVDPATGAVKPIVERPLQERFKGCNDLTFGRNGDLYFTDQGQSGLHRPDGRLFCLRSSGRLDLLMDNLPSPNGLAFAPGGQLLYLALTCANAIWRLTLDEHGRVAKAGLFVQLSGGLSGPDGVAVDQEGNLAVAHNGHGAVHIFSRLGDPLVTLRSPAGLATTNIAYGGSDGRRLFVTESQTGSVLCQRLPCSSGSRSRRCAAPSIGRSLPVNWEPAR